MELAHILAKQRNALEVLKRDNVALKEELRLENKHSFSPTTAYGDRLVAQLQEESDGLTRTIGLERSLLADNQERCRVILKKIQGQRQGMGGLTAAQKQDFLAHRSVKREENRLQVAWQTRNEALAATGELRRRIEGLRRERLACTDLLRKSDSMLEAHRNQMTELLTISAAATEEREKVLAEVLSLHSKVDRLQNSSEAEWNQLSRIIQQDRQARENARQGEIEQRERRTQALVKSEIGGQRRATAVGWGLARNKAAQNASANRMAQLTEDFAAVQAATGTDSPKALAEQLIAAEESKFHVFSYMNEMNVELEVLEGQISVLQSELKQATADASVQQEKTRLKQQAMEERLKIAQHEAETYEGRAGRALQRVTFLRNTVAELFAAASCDSAAVRDLLGPSGVTAANMMQYLGILEQRTNHLLQACIAGFIQPPLEHASSQPKSALKSTKQPDSAHSKSPVQDILISEPPSVLIPAPTRPEAHDTDLDNELLLDSKALQLAAERSFQRRLEEVPTARPGTMTRHHAALRK